jgi:hypothetical protein
MKTRLFTFAALLLILVSCKKDPKEPKAQFEVNNLKINLGGIAGAMDSILIQSSVNWNATVTSSATWLALSTTSGNGNGVILLTATEKNLGTEQRTATITITPGGNSLQPVSISVTQEALTPALRTDSTSLSIKGVKDAKDSFSIQSNLDWQVTSSVGWLDVSRSNGSGNAMIFITSKENNFSGASRSAVLTISPVGNNTVQSKTINVTQPSGLQDSWTKLYGGSQYDGGTWIIATSDGGYLIGGNATSNNGDISGNHGGVDAWLLKVDANGSKEWSKVFGGSGSDVLYSVAAAKDGGYVLVGNTMSNDGDIVGSHGGQEAWLLKVDASGNKQWSKTFGGTGNDDGRAVASTADGGFILSGMTSSNDGDVTALHGINDGFVVKVDASGNKQWSKTYGGTLTNFISAIATTADGGYVMAGGTTSNDGDVSGNHGGLYAPVDAWVAKLDGNGTIQWSRLIGGVGVDDAQAIIATADGGCMMLGRTTSNDGDATGNHGGTDILIARLDANGNKQWSQAYGGSANDEFAQFSASTNGGYVITLGTASNDGDITGNHGGQDAWLFKIDAAGNKQWSRAYGGTGDENGAFVIEIANGNYVMVGGTNSSDGDFSGKKGGASLFITKFKPQ